MDTALHFRRFEFKYLLNKAEESRIKSYLARYMVPDPQAHKTGSYEVVSLYFDSPAFYYYHEKTDGIKKRKKIRLRTYRTENAFSHDVFFEIKRKIDAVVLKDRFSFDRGRYVSFMEQWNLTGVPHLNDDKNVSKILHEFDWERRLRSISPKILVAYEREPFLGKYNQHVRITFDRAIRAREDDNLFYAGDEWEDVSRGKTVMEIKFTGLLPFYITKVIHLFNLERVAFSKYCNSVDACGSLSYKDSSSRTLFSVQNNFNHFQPIWNLL